MNSPASTSMSTGPVPVPFEPQTLAGSLQALDARLEALSSVIDALQPVIAMIQGAPSIAAMLGDSFDDLVRSARDSGIDIERGVVNGAGAALRFGAVMDPEKVLALEALLKSGVLDPAALRIIGDAGRALVETSSARPQAIGVVGLLKALRDPDLQRALGFLVEFAGRFGRCLPSPPSAR